MSQQRPSNYHIDALVKSLQAREVKAFNEKDHDESLFFCQVVCVIGLLRKRRRRVKIRLKFAPVRILPRVIFEEVSE